MKIGILSMQRIPNYGSFLQALSLKKQCERLCDKAEVYFVDIEEGKHLVPAVSSSMTNGVFFDKFDKYLFKRIDNYLLSKKMRAIHAEDGIKYLELEKKLPSDEKFDLVICGSDEVFNAGIPSAWGFSTQLFGNVKNAKRVVTYAASCGQTTKVVTDKYGMTNDIASAMKNFETISVRDSGTFDFVHDITGREAQMHVDPVFLTDFDKYIPFLSKRKPYLLVYAYGNRINDECEIESIKKYAKENDLEIVSVGTQQRWCNHNIAANAFGLLAYVKGASCIVTDTFHGTVFSVKYNKQFTVFIRESNRNKLGDLLKTFNLSSRLVERAEMLSSVMSDKIDWTTVNKIISEEQKRSYDYLKRVISENGENG